MILKQYYLGCLSHASYLVGDEEAKVAAVVDPQRDVDAYLEDAARMGLSIRHVLLTHFHADFVSGHLELRDRCGADIGLGARGRADYPFHALADGDAIDLGRVRLEILETPGHTPEGISIVVTDRAGDGAAPHAVFTGDTLFIGDVGRPDLMASSGVTAVELAGMLYDSLHRKLLALPDETLVYPAHGAGSMCGKNLSKDTVSTLGVQRRTNYALQPMSREEFVRLVAADQPEAPAYFGYDAALNRRERPTMEAALAAALRPLPLEEVIRRGEAGAQVLDVREPAEFESGHLAGSLNIGLSGKYATWAGTLLDRDREIVLIAPPGREREAALRLGRIGFDRVGGFLEGGPEALGARPDRLRRTARVTPPELARLLAGAEPPLVLDVRTASEWQDARIGESLNVPLNQIPKRLAEIPRGRPMVIHCLSGYRSSVAASILRRHGIHEISDLAGGIQAWHKETAASRS